MRPSPWHPRGRSRHPDGLTAGGGRVAQLGSSSFRAREEAARALEVLGPVALEHLGKALASAGFDLETRLRVEALITRINRRMALDGLEDAYERDEQRVEQEVVTGLGPLHVLEQKRARDGPGCRQVEEHGSEAKLRHRINKARRRSFS